MKFLVQGTFKMGENRNQKFRKEIEAENKFKAIDKIMCLLGSNHKCKRHLVKIEKIEEVK